MTLPVGISVRRNETIYVREPVVDLEDGAKEKELGNKVEAQPTRNMGSRKVPKSQSDKG